MVMREFLNRYGFQRIVDTTKEVMRGPGTVGEGCTAAGGCPYAEEDEGTCHPHKEADQHCLAKGFTTDGGYRYAKEDDMICHPHMEVDRDRIAKRCTRRRWTMT